MLLMGFDVGKLDIGCNADQAVPLVEPFLGFDSHAVRSWRPWAGMRFTCDLGLRPGCVPSRCPTQSWQSLRLASQRSLHLDPLGHQHRQVAMQPGLGAAR